MKGADDSQDRRKLFMEKRRDCGWRWLAKEQRRKHTGERELRIAAMAGKGQGGSEKGWCGWERMIERKMVKQKGEEWIVQLVQRKIVTREHHGCNEGI